MSQTIQIIQVCAGAFCLGAAAAIAAIVALAGRNSEERAEGCFGRFLIILAIGAAMLFFFSALSA